MTLLKASLRPPIFSHPGFQWTFLKVSTDTQVHMRDKSLCSDDTAGQTSATTLRGSVQLITHPAKVKAVCVRVQRIDVKSHFSPFFMQVCPFCRQ